MNRRNYCLEMEDIIFECAGKSIKPTLLLHACCAPCASHCVELLSKFFDITLFFYNPNISSKEEYDKRESELRRFIRDAGLDDEVKIVAPVYDNNEFEEVIKGLEGAPEGGDRCHKCYELRISATAKYAAENGFDYFTTTLSISPLKNPVWINEIGEAKGNVFGVKHLPSEFKKKGGYQRSIELSKQYNLYRQNYCGCKYSRKEEE